MAAKRGFSISAAVSYGWKIATSKLKFFIPLLLIILIVPMLPDLIYFVLIKESNHVMNISFEVIKWIIQLVISLGAIYIALKIYDKKKVSLSDLFAKINLIIPYFLATVLTIIVILPGVGLLMGGVFMIIFHFIAPKVFEQSVLVGSILAIIGLIWSTFWGIRLHYYPYLIVDKNAGPIECIKGSWKLTKGFFWKIFFLGIVLSLVNVVGFFFFIVGLFVTIPLSMMAEAYVFRKLQGK